jgi:hypothetical protein|tara:strand:+ start:76 stop:444 length:369 start_codon:yes stop_codon:yes gene_type:complete
MKKEWIYLIVGAGLMAAVNTYSEDTKTTKVKSLEDYEKLIGVDVTWEMIQREFTKGDVMRVNSGPHVPLYCMPTRAMSYPKVLVRRNRETAFVYCIYNGVKLRKIEELEIRPIDYLRLKKTK